MSLRGRLTMLTATAVALAIVAASIAAWLVVRSSMLGEVDKELLRRAPAVDRIAELSASIPQEGVAQRRFIRLVQGNPVGVQITGSDGETRQQLTFGPLTDALQQPAWLPADPKAGEPRLDTIEVQGDSYRVLSARVGDGGVLRVFQPLASVDAALKSVTWWLVGIAALGVALAAALGWIIARAGLRPVYRLVRSAEKITKTQDLTERIEAGSGRRDEIGRLSGSINAMLAALESARREQRELIENASHELRTPLAVLRNDFGLLARTERPDGAVLAPADRAQLIDDLDAQVSALAEEVDQIVTLARGEVESETPQRVDLRTLVERAVHRTRRLNPAVEVTVHGSLGEALVYPAALERAVANLVRNAVQVSPDHQTVDVEAARQAGEFRIEVRDRGPGLAPEEIPQLFTRFYRGANARSRRGSGLGLAIVHQVATLHGGEVRALNRTGGGARFIFRWATSGS